jgi:hypothetical protein
MPISVTDRIVALCASLTNEQIEALSPAERQRLEHATLATAIRAAPPGTVLKREGPAKDALDGAILARLARGERPE